PALAQQRDLRRDPVDDDVEERADEQAEDRDHGYDDDEQLRGVAHGAGMSCVETSVKVLLPSAPPPSGPPPGLCIPGKPTGLYQKFGLPVIFPAWMEPRR